jgi:hypothetical protein
MAKAQTYQHRGRLQAQGGQPELEESESWARQQPLRLVDGHRLLDTLRNRIARREQELRRIAFDQARAYMTNVSRSGGVVGQIKKSFPQGNRGLGPRVDIEVNKGIAFVA